MDKYKDIPGVNFSTLRHMKKSPAHYRYACDNPPAQTEPMNFGRMFHHLVLEPETFSKEWFVIDMENRPEKTMTMAANANKAWIAKIYEDNKDRSTCTKDQYDEAQAMRDGLMRDQAIRELLTVPGKVEHTIEWIDEETGLRCKGRVDRYIEAFGAILDIKTCESAKYGPFIRHAYDYDLHIQAAMYFDGLKAKSYRLIPVEKKPPYVPNIIVAPKEYIDFGRNEYRRLLRAVKECTERGTWPGYDYWSPLGGYDMDIPSYGNYEVA